MMPQRSFMMKDHHQTVLRSAVAGCAWRWIGHKEVAALQGQITDRGSYHELEAKGIEFKQFELRKDDPESQPPPTELTGAMPLPSL